MKLNLQNVLKYKSILLSTAEQGHPVYSSLFLDFTNEKAYFSNASFAGVVDIKVTVEDGEDIPNSVFVPLDKMVHLLSRGSEINLDSEGTILLASGDKVKLSVMEDASYTPPGFILDDDTKQSSTIKDFSSVAGRVKQAMLFADDLPETAMNGVFFKDGNIIAAEATRMYQVKNVVEDLPDGNFSIAMCKVLVALQGEEVVTITTTPNILQLSVASGLTIQTGVSSFLEMIDVFDPDFVSSYDHEDSVTFPRDKFLEELNFITPFFNQDHGMRIKIAFLEDAIQFIVDEEDKITTLIQDVEYSDFEAFRDQTKWISGHYLKIIGNVLEKDRLTLKLSSDSPILDFVADDDLHIIKVAFEEVEE